VLSMKNIPYEYKAVDLVKEGGEQLKPEYANEVNPMKGVPSLVVDGKIIAESVAIMEFLEETHPNPPLLPKDPFERAKVRQIVEAIASDIQPPQNLRVLKRLEEAKRPEWAKYWIEEGFKGLELVLKQTSGEYCVGDQITFADCLLVPQVYNAVRWKVDMNSFPVISRINDALMKLEAFQKTHPDQQPDAPK